MLFSTKKYLIFFNYHVFEKKIGGGVEENMFYQDKNQNDESIFRNNYLSG